MKSINNETTVLAILKMIDTIDLVNKKLDLKNHSKFKERLL